MVLEKYGLEQRIFDMDISYLPHDLARQFESPSMIVSNNLTIEKFDLLFK